jgi:tetratricopeptide (TPR) repeat protein
VALLGVALLSLANLYIGKKQGPVSSRASRAAVLEAWNQHDAQKTLDLAKSGLDSNPFEPFFLSFQGIASYYLSLGKNEGDERQGLLDQTVFSLRKALALNEKISVRPQIEYVLGKAYYQKGQPWFDLALKHLETAKQKGFSANDLEQYLGLANVGLFRHSEAAAHFELAIAANPSDVLMLLAAISYKEMGEVEKASSFLAQAIAGARDAVITQRARFLSAEIAIAQGRIADAEAHYEAILQADPRSAEAWYRIGTIYETRGDPIKARSAWRKATSIDPNHAEARKKLVERL